MNNLIVHFFCVDIFVDEGSKGLKPSVDSLDFNIVVFDGDLYIMGL